MMVSSFVYRVKRNLIQKDDQVMISHKGERAVTRGHIRALFRCQGWPQPPRAGAAGL
jgi:hypothetical protein